MFDKNEISQEDLIKLIVTQESLDSQCMRDYKKKFDACDENEKDEILCELKYRSSMKVLTHQEEGAPRDKYVIGVELAEGDEYDFTNKVVTLNEALVPLTEIMMNFKDKPVSIITGTKAT